MAEAALTEVRGGLSGVLRAFLKGDIAARPMGAVIAVLLGTFMTSLFTRDFGVSLADIRGAFGLSVDEGAWLSTLTNAPQLLVAPATPLLVMIFGPRRILLGAAGSFVAATALLPLVSGFMAIFALHILIGCMLGCLVPASLSIIFANLSPRYWLIALGLYSVRTTLTLHSGVSLSGWFVEDLGWQAIYWQASLFGVAFFLLAAISFPERESNLQLWRRTNKGEVMMYCTGLTLIYIGLDQGNRLDWLQSGTVIALIGGGVLLVAGAVGWQFLSPIPFAHPKALLRRNIYLPLIIVTLFGMMSAATSLLIPGFLATVGHLKPVQSGSALWWIDLVQFAAIPLSIWSIRQGYPRLTLLAGLLLVMAGCWLSGVTNVWRGDDFAVMSLLAGAGASVVLLTSIAITIASAKREDLIGLVAYIQIPRVIGPEIAAAVLPTLIRKREAVHSVLLGGGVDRVRAFALDHVPGALAGVVRREAFVLAYADAYRFCFWVAAASAVMALVLRPVPPHPLTHGAAH